MLLDTATEQAVFVARLLWLDTAAARVVLHDGYSVRTYDFGSRSWSHAGDCFEAEVAPDHASVACLSLDGSFSRIELTQPFAQCRFVPAGVGTLAVSSLGRVRQRVRIVFTPRADGDSRVEVTTRRRAKEDLVVRVRGRPRADRTVDFARVVDAWNGDAGRCAATDSSASPLRADLGANAVTFTNLDTADCDQLARTAGRSEIASCRVWTTSESDRKVVEICLWERERDGVCGHGSGALPSVVITNPARPSSPDRLMFDGDVVLAGVLGGEHTLVLSSIRGLWAFDYDENSLRFLGRCWNPAVSPTHAAVACVHVGGGLQWFAKHGAQWTSRRASPPIGMSGVSPSETLGFVTSDVSRAFLHATASSFEGVPDGSNTLVPFDSHLAVPLEVNLTLPDEVRAWFVGE